MAWRKGFVRQYDLNHRVKTPWTVFCSIVHVSV